MPNRSPEPPRRRIALALALIAAGGCNHPSPGGGEDAKSAESEAKAAAEASRGAQFRVASPKKQDMRITVLQPGTIQAFEVTPIYARIAGYVRKYNVNIGDEVKAGDVLLEMTVPDLVEQHAQKAASARLAEVMIRVAESVKKSASARLESANAAITSSRSGVLRAQAEHDRWESEYRRTTGLVAGKVLDQQVNDETYRQLSSATASRDQANAMVLEAVADRDRIAADLEKASVDIEAAKAQLEVSRAEERLAAVMLDYGKIRAPYDGVITQRNVNPGEYIQPSVAGAPPLYVLEQVDPVRVFVGVPELSSAAIRAGDTATLRLQALPGREIEGKVVRSGFSLNPVSRTMQTEIDIPNPHHVLRPAMYVTASIVIDRPGVFAVPSQAVAYQGQRAYSYFIAGKKARRTLVQVGPSDDSSTEVVRYQDRDRPDLWHPFDGSERLLVGSFDSVQDGQAVPDSSIR